VISLSLPLPLPLSLAIASFSITLALAFLFSFPFPITVSLSFTFAVPVSGAIVQVIFVVLGLPSPPLLVVFVTWLLASLCVFIGCICTCRRSSSGCSKASTRRATAPVNETSAVVDIVIWHPSRPLPAILGLRLSSLVVARLLAHYMAGHIVSDARVSRSLWWWWRRHGACREACWWDCRVATVPIATDGSRIASIVDTSSANAETAILDFAVGKAPVGSFEHARLARVSLVVRVGAVVMALISLVNGQRALWKLCGRTSRAGAKRDVKGGCSIDAKKSRRAVSVPVS
jgi:hypothetical protein